jgi:hypothetical protein
VSGAALKRLKKTAINNILVPKGIESISSDFFAAGHTDVKVRPLLPSILLISIVFLNLQRDGKSHSNINALSE